MSKRKSLLSVMICICLLFTACGNEAEEAVKRADGGRPERAEDEISEREVTGAAVFGTTDTTIGPEKLPDKLKAIGDEVDVIFHVIERTKQGYRAKVEVVGWENVHPDWELCFELEDEITEIAGAEIKSREGKLYTVQGTLEEQVFFEEEEDGKIIWFDIKVACPNGAHEPGICYWKSEFEDVPEKDYKIETLKEEIQGRKVCAKLRLTNCSGERMDYWTLWIGADFDIESISGAEVCYQHEWDVGDNFVCGEAGNRSLGNGESVEITFTGECEKGTPYWEAARVEVAKDRPGNFLDRFFMELGKSAQ